MSSDPLSQAVELIRAGKKLTARDLLMQQVQQQPDNESIWLWLAETFDTDAERVRLLRRYLKINPRSPVVTRAVEILEKRQTSPEAPAAAVPLTPVETPTPPAPPPASLTPVESPIPPVPPSAPFTLVEAPVEEMELEAASPFTEEVLPAETVAAAQPVDSQPAAARPSAATPRKTQSSRPVPRKKVNWLWRVVLILLALFIILALALAVVWVVTQFTNPLPASAAPGAVPAGAVATAVARIAQASAAAPPIVTPTAAEMQVTTPPDATAAPSIQPLPTLPPGLPASPALISPENLEQVGLLAESPAGVFSAARSRLAWVDGGSVVLWDALTATELRRVDASAGVTGMAFSPDGHWLALADRTPLVLLINVDSGQPEQALEFDPAAVRQAFGQQGSLKDIPLQVDLIFSPDGSRLAASYPGAVVLWNLTDSQRVASITALPEQVLDLAGQFGAESRHLRYALAFTARGDRLAVGGYGRINVLDSGGKNVVNIATISPRLQLAFSPDGKLLAESGEGYLNLWTVSNGKRARRLPGVASRLMEPSGFAFSPDGKSLALERDGDRMSIVVDVHDLSSGRSRQVLSGLQEPAGSLGFSPDGRLLLVGDSGGQAALLLSLKGQKRISFAGVGGLSFSPDGRYLSGESGGRLQIYGLAQP